MERVPVTSSNVADVGYDSETQTLKVGFKDGGVYAYFAVPPSVASGLVNAASVGGYLAASVKGIYEYRKIR